MRPHDLRQWNRATPFVPYRRRLNDGRTFDVRHPEMVRIGRTTAVVFTFQGDPNEPFERMEMISLVLIESIAPIETAAAA
jgi:hypothetical protein